MNRSIALLLCLSMLLCGSMALADKTEIGALNVNGAFELKCTLPEGYELNIEQADTTQIDALIASEDATRPTMHLTVAFNELLSDTDRLNDLDDAELAVLEQTFRAEDDVNISYRNTDHGTKLLIAELKGEYVVFYTIYKGFEIEFLLTAGSEPLTGAQIDMVVSFLSDLDFVSAN